MGRPLYSRTLVATPAVWDLDPPVCEKWSYLNAFDPDSDEFFDNENAVYEDFIDPVTPISPDEDEVDERDMLVVRMGNASPVSSESSLSDSDSPLALTPEEPSPLVMNAFRDSRQTDETERGPALAEPAVRVRLAGRETRWPRRVLATRSPFRSDLALRSDSLPVPPPSAPIPVPTPSRRSVTADEWFSPSPSTPPRQTMAHFAMSPPPTSTPRLYTWARNPSQPASPSSSGPFTNPHARTSYAHLSPVLIRIRDVTV